MNTYIKLGSKNQIAHCIFGEILVDEIKNEHEYASKLKKCMSINLTNSTQHAVVNTTSWTDDGYSTLRQLADMNFEMAVLWFDGTWPMTAEFDDELLKEVSTWDDWFCAGHIIDRLISAQAPEWHKQCVVLNLKKWAEIDYPEFEWNDFYPGFIPSEENFHDEYTPMYLTPTGKTLGGLDFAGDEFDALIAISLANNCVVRNLSYDIRNEKYCCYPEDDIEQTKMWMLDVDWNKQDKEFLTQFYYDEVPEDKREMYGFKVMDSHVMYITNTEDVPEETDLPVDVIIAPCSGLHQFRHMTNAGDNLKKVIWSDFSWYATEWTKFVLNNWDGTNFEKFVEDNIHTIMDNGFHRQDCIIYDVDLVGEFIDSYDSQEQWLEHWNHIRNLEHVFLNIDIVKNWNTLVEEVGKDNRVFLQISNIWSYEINYINTHAFQAQAAFLNLVNELLINNKDVYLTGDTPHGFYHSYHNIRSLPGIL